MSTFLVDIKGNVSLLLITDHQILLENFLAEWKDQLCTNWDTGVKGPSHPDSSSNILEYFNNWGKMELETDK